MGTADITLRHVSRRHAEALARPYVSGGPVEIVGWADTQVTAVERRLDKTLLLRLTGRLRALEIEFVYRYERDLPDRILEYQGMTRMAFRDAHPDQRPPPMETVVILLTGRRKQWPDELALRTGWRERRFSGTRFRVDAIYQRTVAELVGRGSPLWLAFTPLARDATPHAMREVVAALRAQVPDDDDRWDLLAAMLVLADVDAWGHNLRREIEAMIQYEERTDLIDVSKTLRDAYDRGQRVGIEKGIEQMLRGLFMSRLQRSLTLDEQQALATRATRDPKLTQDKALSLEGEALATWLLSPATR
jgi:hypothetical protein